MNKALLAGVIGDIVGSDNVKTDEFLKYHTSFKVGGPADILAVPQNIEDLIKVYKVCLSSNIPVFVMGNGTNLLVRDNGIRGVVIKIFDNLSRYKVKDGIITAEAGILLSRLSKLAMEHSLAGLEFAEGIPGTLGGAVAMNAGAYIGEIKDVTVKTEYLDMSTGEVRVLLGEQHQFGKRTSYIQKNGGIVLKSELRLKKGNRADIKALMDDFNRRRRDSQPLELPSAGSIFKRPEGYFAGKLVQDCGLRGCSIGGAEVSTKHCGFIVNKGEATAEDVLKLIKHIQDTVKARFGVDMETEVRIVGEE